MKRIYIILFAAALSAPIFSCKEKTPSEKLNDRIEEASDSVKNAVETESEKTTKNGSDAH